MNIPWLWSSRLLKRGIAGALIFFLSTGSSRADGDSSFRIAANVASVVEALRTSDSSDASAAYLLPFKSVIDSAAKKYHLPAALLAAFIQEESAFDEFATRTEPGYLKKKQVIAEARAWSTAHHGIPTATTELFLRSTSFGLMQPMGQVAREQGFSEKYLSALITPFNSIDQGAKHLLKKMKRYPQDTLSAISAYNQGDNRKRRGHFMNARYVYRVEVAWKVYEDLFNVKYHGQNQNFYDQTTPQRSSYDSLLRHYFGYAPARMRLQRSSSGNGSLAYGETDTQAASGFRGRWRYDTIAHSFASGTTESYHSQTAGDNFESGPERIIWIGAGLFAMLGFYWFLCFRYESGLAGYDLHLPEHVDRRVTARLKRVLAKTKDRRALHGERFTGEHSGLGADHPR